MHSNTFLTGTVKVIELAIFFEGHEISLMGTKIVSDSGKFSILSPKPFTYVFVVCVYFICFFILF